MDIEVNKIAGAVLGTLMFAVGLNILGDGLFAPNKPAVPGYDLPVPQEEAAAGAAAGAAAPPPGTNIARTRPPGAVSILATPLFRS